jgi:Zn-dependent protease with chaperone function
MSSVRRKFLLGAGGCVAGLCGLSHAGILPTDLEPLVDANYEPSDADERGIWQSLERMEEEIQDSPQRLRDSALQAYSTGIVERLVGRAVPDLRIYLMRDASFNASMAPSGMMVVHTGLLVRMQNEAEFAAVLGHEAGHYFRRHTIESYRGRRRKAAAAAFVAATAGVAAGASARQGYSGQSWIDVANSINASLVLSMFQFSRTQEAEADAYGISLMARSGYEVGAASEVWKHLIEERKASAAQRNKRYRDYSRSALSTHPPSDDRMADLADTAASLSHSREKHGSDGRAEWQAAIAPHRAMLLAEQVMLNDPGASLYLINAQAQDGWNGSLRFSEGEVYRLRGDAGDDAKAFEAYAASTAFADAPAESWRAHGYALLKAGKAFEGRAALERYLTMNPTANDVGMIRYTLAQ